VGRFVGSPKSKRASRGIAGAGVGGGAGRAASILHRSAARILWRMPPRNGGCLPDGLDLRRSYRQCRWPAKVLREVEWILDIAGIPLARPKVVLNRLFANLAT
jgi:hypothetical protein